MAGSLFAKFVSKKISKIRWKPLHEEGIEQPQFFVAGSWDDTENSITLWWSSIDEPVSVSTLPHEGNVTDIQFTNADSFMVSSSNGSTSLYQIIHDDSGGGEPYLGWNLQLEHSWKDLHYFGSGISAPCTGISCKRDEVVSVGEDGSIVVASIKARKEMRRLDSADSCSLTCTTHLSHSELLTGNQRGQLKVWDLRSGENKPCSYFMLSADQIGVSCVSQHPTQPHVVVTGSYRGGLAIWDTRQDKYPVTQLSAHSALVSEIKFHPTHPQYLFTCSHDGSLWQWDSTASSRNIMFTVKQEVETTSWLTADGQKNSMEVFSLIPPIHLPVNTLDVIQNHLLAGTDTESIFMLRKLQI